MILRLGIDLEALGVVRGELGPHAGSERQDEMGNDGSRIRT